MKLITKTILYYLLVSVPLLVAVSVMSYFSINRAVDENLNEVMWNETENAKAQINSFKEPKNVWLSFDSLSGIKIDTNGSKGYGYINLLKMDPEDGEMVEYKALRSYYKSKGTNYLITIMKPKLEKDDLIENLVQTLLITIAFLVLGFFAINWLLSKSLWKPFYRTINQLDKYDIKNHNELNFGQTSTSEFRQLNAAVKKMTDKIRADFMVQKEFTENASHETQTPLAVIKARIDLLLQSPNLKENEMKQLEIIEQAVTKLSSLNKALLLLAKIENNQFKEVEEVDLETVLNKTLLIYEDMIASKNITVNKTIIGPVEIKINSLLADILISNLIQNAVRHNEVNGTINIELSAHTFSIANTGNPLTIEAEAMFTRFKKNDGSKESLGLGLAIVKSIMEAYHYKFNYSYIDKLHTFVMEF